VKTFLYRCPNSQRMVQGVSELRAHTAEEYHVIKCIDCRGKHLVNPTTGEVLGLRTNDEES
jgi:hypothetical protein